MDIIGAITAAATVVLFIVSSFTHRETDAARMLPLACFRVHGNGVMVLNTISVSFVFWKHMKVIDLYAAMIVQREWSTDSEHHVSLLLRNVVRIKASLSTSTRLLASIFSSATVLSGIGTIATLYLHASHTLSSDVYAFACVFLLLQSVFFYVIWRLSESKDDIVRGVNSGVFADVFLVRRPVDTANAETRARRGRRSTGTWSAVCFRRSGSSSTYSASRSTTAPHPSSLSRLSPQCWS